MRKPLPEAFERALRAELPDVYVTDEAELEEYGRDWTRVVPPAPGGLALPRSTDEVARVMRLAAAHDVAVVPSGGRTGLAGGAVAANGELVLSLARMRKLHPVDERGATVRVEAGAVTEAVHQHTEPHGLTWPVDFASKGSSTVGGNIATNAGGVKVIRWGLTRQWVLGLTVVLASGEVLEIGGALEKDNTGVDLRQLFIGSEGTLGIVTEATLKLAKKAGDLDVGVLGLRSLDDALSVLAELRRSPLVPSAFELFTDRCLARVTRHRGVRPPFDATYPAYVLCEVERAPDDAFETFVAALAERGLVEDAVLARHGAEAKALWTLREGISESLSATGFPHKNDVSLPIARLPEFVSRLEQVFAERYPGWEICIFGHVGDGNLHLNVMKPDGLTKEAFLEQAHRADHDVFALVEELDGSISAEHGIGLLKKAHLHRSRSPGELALARALKRTLDPKNLLNPGKILDLQPGQDEV